MRHTGILLLSAVVSGCATNSALKSNWSALEGAENLDCNEIPLLPEDLRINDVHLIEDLGPTLLLDVSSRKGVKTFYHLPFKELDDLRAEKLVRLPVSNDAEFLGAAYVDKQAAFALKSTNRAKSSIQIRDLLSNAVLADYPFKDAKQLDLGPWKALNGSLYTLGRVVNDEESVEDQPYTAFKIPLGKKGQVQTSVNPSVIGQTALLTDHQGQPHMLWLDRGVSSKVKEPRFRIIGWNAGKKGESYEIDEKGPIESWSFDQRGDRLVIAFVKGDSLLWENTSLEVIQLADSSPFSKRQQFSLPLSRVHVAQPLLAGGPQGEFLFLPQWLDHELTVGVYRVDGGEIQSIRFAGIFKEGTAFFRAFYHEPSERYYLLSRMNSGSLPKYSLCAVKL